MTEKKPGLNLAFSQIVLTHAQFRHREDFLKLPAHQRPQPQQLDLQVETSNFNEGDVSAIKVRVSTEPDDKESLYQFSVEIMALVHKGEGQEGLMPQEFVRTAGVATLYPFIRETVANLTMRGRFGPVWMNPIDLRTVPVPEVPKATVEA